MARGARTLLLVGCAVLWALPATAQWTQRTIALNPGWNAVYLDVQPEPRACAEAFDGLPVETVWYWSKRFSTVQYIQDPTTLRPEQPDWAVYIPADQPDAHLTNLFTVQAGGCYLIEISGSNAVNWSVFGQPYVKPVQWVPNSFNLVGFPVDAAVPPTFTNFFASSDVHAGTPVYRLNTLGRWEEVTAPDTDTLRSHEAYWVYTKGSSQFDGPLTVELEQGTAIDFADQLNETRVIITNHTAVSRTVTAAKIASLDPSSTAYFGKIGPVPLSYYDRTEVIGERTWEPFDAPLTQTLAPGEQWNLRLEIRRRDMAPAFLPSGFSEALYQDMIEFYDGDGTRVTVGVRAEGLEDPVAIAKALGKGEAPPDPRAGLWAGVAEINAVSQTAGEPLPVSSGGEFQFRIILHVDNHGDVTFLRHVTKMWRTPLVAPDPEDANQQIIQEPGYFVLITYDDLFDARHTDGTLLYSGSRMPGEEPVGARLSTAAFAFDYPIPMSGQFPTLTNFNFVVDCEIRMPFDHPLNPFVHKFHPDHDNMHVVNNKLEPYADGEGIESYSVKRTVIMTFTEACDDCIQLPGFGDSSLAGAYEEYIEGIHKDTITIEGTFILHRVSPIAVLDDAAL